MSKESDAIAKEKKYFALRLLPSRPDFAQTMSEEERRIMTEHLAYWKEYMKQGIVLVFGPVFDPQATYGLGIVAVENEEQLTELMANDPAVKINRYEFSPMAAVVPENV